jgi:hypothetical protein
MRGGKHHFFYPLDTIAAFVNIIIIPEVRTSVIPEKRVEYI